MEKFIPKTSQGIFLRLTGNYLYVSKMVMARASKLPEKDSNRVDLYFDKKNKVLRLDFNDKGLLLLRKNRQVSVAGLDMPKGRYFLMEEDIYKFVSL